MPNTTFDDAVERLLALCASVRTEKSRDYNLNNGPFSNFKNTAHDFGITKYQAWGVHAKKQFDAIINAINANPHAPSCNGEAISSRIVDTINYAMLLYGMLLEDAIEVTIDPKADFDADVRGARWFRAQGVPVTQEEDIK